MNQVADLTELNKATLYSYFSNKDDLIDAIVYDGLVLLEKELQKERSGPCTGFGESAESDQGHLRFLPRVSGLLPCNEPSGAPWAGCGEREPPSPSRGTRSHRGFSAKSRKTSSGESRTAAFEGNRYQSLFDPILCPHPWSHAHGPLQGGCLRGRTWPGFRGSREVGPGILE